MQAFSPSLHLLSIERNCIVVLYKTVETEQVDFTLQ